MIFRRIREPDRGAWLAMRHTLWPESGWAELDAETVEFLGKPETYPVWVCATGSGELIGFIEVSCRDYVDGCKTSPVGYVEGIYVDPEYRHQGIARQFFEIAEAWARAQGCVEMASDTDLDNQISRDVHHKVGYEEAARLVIFRKLLGD
jgi:aminoglycoside 6'-N-acetyltransferase I